MGVGAWGGLWGGGVWGLCVVVGLGPLGCWGLAGGFARWGGDMFSVAILSFPKEYDCILYYELNASNTII